MKKAKSRYPQILVPVKSDMAETDCACPSEQPLLEEEVRRRLTRAERKLMKISEILAEAGFHDSDDPEEAAKAAADFCKYSHPGANVKK